MGVRESFSQGEIDGLMRGIVRGRYHTLLGAGASAGGTSNDGRPLPIGEGLALELEDAFHLPNGAAKTHPLSRVYAAASKKVDDRGRTLGKYMRDRFTRTSPPDWMRHFVALPWAQAWTLNVDDTLETAYTNHADVARRTPLSASWTEPHRVARDSRNEMLLVHLHGKASKPDDLVFDISTYINALESQHRWHKLFGDTYSAQPFIVIGASLAMEIDLEQVLERGTLRTSEHPSLIVLRECDDLQRDYYETLGLKVVTSTAEEFFDEITSMLPRYVSELTQAEADSLSSVTPQAQVFLQEWRELTDSPWPRRIDKGHSFYAGHEPTWRDIVDDLPFRRTRENEIASSLTRDLAPGKSTIAFVGGEAFAGKSSTLLSIANTIRLQGWRVFYFDAGTSPDGPAAAWWVREHPRTVLVLDDATDFATDIDAMVRSSNEGAAGFRFLIADRSSQTARLRKLFFDLDFRDFSLDSRLRDSEIDSMIAKLDQKRRLGILQNVRARDRRGVVISDRRRSLFETMSSLEDGRGFRSRVEDEWLRLSSDEDRALVGVTAIAASSGYALPLELLRAAVGMGPVDADARIRETRLFDLISVREDVIQMRHRAMGELLAREFIPTDDRLAFARNLAASLAPHVSPAAISTNSVFYRIARSLMARSFVLSLADSRMPQAREWFASIQDSYDWNARYWEQRALLAAEDEDFEPAFSWAQVAVGRRRDSYSLNTVGTVLMRRALWESSPSHWPDRSFESAVQALRDARDLEGRDSEYPYDTFFSYTSRLVEKVRTVDAALREQLESIWVEWQVSSLGLSAGARSGLERTLDHSQRRWDAVMRD